MTDCTSIPEGRRKRWTERGNGRSNEKGVGQGSYREEEEGPGSIRAGVEVMV